MTGTIINNEYEILEEIYSGGFGVVYRGRDLQLGKQVAIKFLHPMRAAETEAFLREAKLLASVNHPNVITIHRMGDFEGRPFIVMTYVEGMTLRNLLEGPQVEAERMVALMSQVARGLEAVHAAGVVHRDLSWNNVMITADWRAVILDFGLAKVLGGPVQKSSEDKVKGTYGYHSPEQLLGRPISTATDVFSFGVLLYQTLSWMHPFQAEHHMSMVYDIVYRDPIPLSQLVPHLPDDLLALVDRCLDKDATSRPPMTAVADTLGRVVNDGSAGGEKRMSTARLNRQLAPSNPYLNRVMLQRWRDFFGRKQEVRRIYARLNATPPGSVSVVGDRKIGKSSLLNYIYMDQNRKTYLEDPRRMIMVFLDFQRERAMTIEAFVSALLSMAQLELRDQLTVSDCSHDLDGVKELVERIHRGGFRLAILLDEFDTVTTNPNFDLQFFAFLRYLANHYNVAYLTSSARDLQVLCSSKDIADSPFFNIFTMMRLSVFTKEEAVELITVPSERAGKPLGPHADKILEIAGLFPFYLQIACSHAFEYLEEHPGQELDLAEVNRCFYEEAKLHYRFIWNNFDEHEKSAMRRVAMGKSVPDSLKHVVQELERRRLVELQQGKPRLFTPIFENFVRLEYGGGKRMLSRLLGWKP